MILTVALPPLVTEDVLMTSYVGFDISLAETSVCVLDAGGKVRFDGKVTSRPDDLFACVRGHADDAERIGLETAQTAALLFRAMEAAGLPVVCLETRHAHKALSARANKTDRNDARGLAELIRVGWCREAGFGACRRMRSAACCSAAGERSSRHRPARL